MVIIRFPDADTKRRALGFLAGRFSFKNYAGREMLVHEAALAYFVVEAIRFSVEDRVTSSET